MGGGWKATCHTQGERPGKRGHGAVGTCRRTGAREGREPSQRVLRAKGIILGSPVPWTTRGAAPGQSGFDCGWFNGKEGLFGGDRNEIRDEFFPVHAPTGQAGAGGNGSISVERVFPEKTGNTGDARPLGQPPLRFSYFFHCYGRRKTTSPDSKRKRKKTAPGSETASP